MSFGLRHRLSEPSTGNRRFENQGPILCTETSTLVLFSWEPRALEVEDTFPKPAPRVGLIKGLEKGTP